MRTGLFWPVYTIEQVLGHNLVIDALTDLLPIFEGYEDCNSFPTTMRDPGTNIPRDLGDRTGAVSPGFLLFTVGGCARISVNDGSSSHHLLA